MSRKIAGFSTVAWALLAGSAAFGQSGSMFLRGQQGQYGSNQPNMVTILMQQSQPPAAPGPTADASAAARGPVPATPAGPGSPAAPTASDQSATSTAGSSAPHVAGAGSPSATDPAGAAPTSDSVLPGPDQSGPSAAGYDPGRPGASPTNMVRSFQTPAHDPAKDANGSPAIAALKRVSFTAISEPEPRQHRVHDLITIVIKEETTISTDGKVDLDKKYTMNADVQKWFKFFSFKVPIKDVPMPNSPGAVGSAERELKSDTTFNRKDSFVGRLTAECIDVKPNGTLVLSAKKFIKTDDEEQFFELTGTCRAQDVNPDNTVLSTQLADLAVTKTHNGSIRDAAKRGLIPWVTDKINPW